MRNDEVYRCRVCGLRLADPPWGLGGRSPSYQHCPCCGVEFGYQDATPIGVRKYREKWLAAGANWDESKRRPDHWDLQQQLQQVPEKFQPVGRIEPKA
jgi:hypothetical protein